MEMDVRHEPSASDCMLGTRQGIRRRVALLSAAIRRGVLGTVDVTDARCRALPCTGPRPTILLIPETTRPAAPMEQVVLAHWIEP